MWFWKERQFSFDDQLRNWLHGEKYVFGSYTRYLLNRFEQNGIRQDGDCWLSTAETRKLLNEMGVFPTKSQIMEIVHCSSMRAHKSGTYDVPTDRIYFPEFCVLISRLDEGHRKRQMGLRPISQRRSPRPVQNSPQKTSIQVFLGGACNPTTWRRDIAIPHLKVHNITYYNPQVANWTPERIEVENKAKKESALFLFVISNETRCIASLVEAAYLAGCGRQLIVVMTAPEPPGRGATIQGELLTQQDYEAVMRSHEFLTDLVERRGLPVFTNIRTALDCAVQVLNQGVSVEDLTREHGAQPVSYSHIAVGFSYIELGEAFDHVDEHQKGNISIRDAFLALRRLGLSPSSDSIPSDPNYQISFPEFCCLFTEYKFGKRNIIRRVVDFIQSLFPASWAREPDYPVLRDVFLGGSCGSSSWRTEIAIPLLRKHGLSFYNPQTSPWSVRYIPMEANVKNRCRVLLFVITANTRATAAMLEAAFYIGLGCEVIVCVQMLPDDDVVIDGEKLTDAAVKDYNRGRVYFSDLANKEGVPVFENIQEAVQCVITLMKRPR